MGIGKPLVEYIYRACGGVCDRLATAVNWVRFTGMLLLTKGIPRIN